MYRAALFAFLVFGTVGLSPAMGQSTAPTPPPDSTLEVGPSSTEADAEWDGPGWDDVRGTVSTHADEHVGAHNGHESPYRQESESNRAAPPVRYNRVEGLVVGLRRSPLSADSEDQTRVFGQAAYAFGLRDLRYTVGVESRLYETDPTSLRFGVQYHEQTLSPDRWKTSYLENSLASIGFEDDFFDYYEAEGLTVYATQTLPRSVDVTAGFRAEAHRPLTPQTDWSLFESGTFRDNSAATAGDLRALFGAVTAGRISDPGGLPTGAALRVAATVADGLGGDFGFTRYEADARGFLPLTPDTRLGLRLRGGYATSGAPHQSRFALGGVGSLRGYGQNRFRGPRMVLANAEYLIDGATVFDNVLDDLFLAGLFDAGWVGGPGTPFRMDDVLPAAGVGLGLDERAVRLDVVWPLRSGPTLPSGPSIRLRISPSF